VWHVSLTRAMAAGMSSAKKLRLITSWSWCFDGWSSLICKAVTRPSCTERGTTINSVEGDKGSVLRTTNKPSLAMDREFR
jgi:hypothetical protein